MRRADRGFTVLELLVVLVLLAIIVAEIGQGLDFGLRAASVQSRLLSQRGDLDGVERLLRGLVARMDPGSVAEPPRPIGERDSFSFTTDLPPGAGAPLERHIDARLTTEGARLVLRWAQHIHSHMAAAGEPSEDTLLVGVTHIQFSYLYPEGAPGSGWVDHWLEPYLPRLVRIHLAFPENDPRQWPDILAAPARDRPSG